MSAYRRQRAATTTERRRGTGERVAEAADIHGTGASAARRWLRRTGILIAGAPLLTGLLLPASSPALAQDTSGHTAAQAQAAQKTAPTGSRTVDVAVNSLTPSVPTHGDTLTLTGTLTNKSRHTVTDASLALRVGPALEGRSAIDGLSKRPGFGSGPEGTQVDGPYAKKFAKLAPGVSQPFTLSIPVKKLDLGSTGVYQLGVELTGQTAAQPWEQTLGIERTVLPWQPDAASTKTKTTYLWPLISATHVTAETGSDEQQTPVFHDDSLAKEIAPGGRLQQMLALGSDLDVTWVIDPDLLASLDAMTKNYKVQRPDGTTVAGTNQALAKQWLNNLEKAVSGKKVVALPFADPDLASLAHTGKNVSGSLGHLQGATTVAATTVETVLHVKPDTDFAWPVDGAVDPSIVDVATSAGAHKVIARSDSFRESGRLAYTPTAARPIGGGTTAVVADAGLSKAFQGDMTRAESATLAVQNFLGQSLMIKQQAPGTPRSIVVAPQRMPTASQAQTMAKALHALQDGGWSQPQDLSAAADAKPDPGASTHVPSTRSYPAALRRQEMPKRAFNAIQHTERKLDAFKVILTDASRVVTPFGRALDRELSTSWRGHGTDAKTFRGGVASYLGGLTKGVGLIEKSDTKLSGRSATIPVTVQNNLVQGVDHLTLRLTSTKPTRLKIGDKPYSEQQVEVSGGHSQSLKFTTTANANGPVPVRAQLFTEDGQPYGDPVTFDVDVTEVTPTVMLVIAGGVLLLVLAGFRMYTTRKRAAARAAAADAQADASTAAQDAPDATATGATERATTDSDAVAADHQDTVHGERPDRQPGATGSGHPSDPAVDTVAESIDPPGAGERVDR